MLCIASVFATYIFNAIARSDLILFNLVTNSKSFSALARHDRVVRGEVARGQNAE